MTEDDQNFKRNNWLAALIFTAFLFLVLGYGWRASQEPIIYETAYAEVTEEFTVLAKGELCR